MHLELKAFSDIVQRPVIVVQTEKGNEFGWSAGFNLTIFYVRLNL